MKRYTKRFTEAKVKLDNDLAEKILNYILENPYEPDAKFHDFASSLKMEPDELEGQVYAILADIVTGGKSKGIMPKDADPKEIELGMKVEIEHVSIPFLARKIVADHLTDRKDYYSFGKKAGIFDEI